VLNERPTAGLAVGVIRGGAPTWFRGYGVADIERFSSGGFVGLEPNPAASPAKVSPFAQVD